MRRVVVAPNALKGSLGAPEAAEALRDGWREVFPEAEYRLVPVSDGGDGFVDSLVAATGGEVREASVTGPLGDRVKAAWGILGDGQTAVIEMALASGLVLIPPTARNPERTTTYGTGELIKAALDAGCTTVLVGIGGSATNDGGMGMAKALGVRFLSADGQELGGSGGDLTRLARLDLSQLDPRLSGVTVRVACDVDNPLTGPKGAAAVYGPQKGATPAMVQRLDAGLANLAELIRRELGKDIAHLPGAGAAGGLGGGLVAFLGATLARGIELMIDATRLEEAVRGADVVLTAEGQIDSQTLHGKAPYGVAQVAHKHGVPVIAFAGRLADVEMLVPDHFDALVGLVPGPQTLAEAMAAARENARTAAARAAYLVSLGPKRAAGNPRKP